MAALSTTVQKIGTNSGVVSVSGSHINWSTATSSVTLTVGDLKNVVLALYNPIAVDNIVVTVSSTQTASRFAGKGIGDLTLTTSLNSSCYMFAGNLESARFKSSANTIVVTATTTICIGVVEIGSTKSN
jgi:hypothetical protein